MKESFLHFIWQFQYFNKNNLVTDQGEEVCVLSPGSLNTDAGPDFRNAKIKVGEIEWFGNVEIHVRSSDWINHNHQNDDAYDNVILHVVYENNKQVKRTDGSSLPTIFLKNKISKKLIKRYDSLYKNKEKIPCKAHFHNIPRIIKLSMLDKALMQRLEEKAKLIMDILVRNNHDWEETTYQLLAKNFGFKINSDAFLRLSCVLPLKILLKHRDNLFQIEALLFGQSGLLDGNLLTRPTGIHNDQPDGKDDYIKLLTREYRLLAHKYSLDNDKLSNMEWKFLRLRPANFPTIRISQFACLIHNTPGFFSTILETKDVKKLYKLFKVQQTDYWQTHYLFDKTATAAHTDNIATGKTGQANKPDTNRHRKIPGFGKMSIENLIINTIAPLLICYAKQKDNNIYIERAVRFLESLPAEKNHIINYWQDINMPMKSAFDTQAGIELYNNFCKKKKCLSCKIGVAIMKMRNA